MISLYRGAIGRGGLVALLLVTSTACGSAVAGPAAGGGGATRPCVDQWTATPVPIFGSSTAKFAGMAAISANDVWAVGATGPANPNDQSFATQTLAEHWDGTKWSVVSVPDLPGSSSFGGDQLTAVSAVSSNDVWAVGYAGRTDYYPPNPPANFSQTVETLIEHWDGSKWSLVSAPDVSWQGQNGKAEDELTGVYASGGSDVEAVGTTYFQGTYVPSASGNPPGAPLIEHWDGSRWAIAAAPDPVAPPKPSDTSVAVGNVTFGTASLNAVAGSSATDVWAVGSYQANVKSTADLPPAAQSLVEHWDGSQWSVASAPDAVLPEKMDNGSNAAEDALNAISSAGGGGFWAVGAASPAGALVMQRHTTDWQLMSPPELGSNATVGAVVAGNPDQVWVLGSVILSWKNKTWTPVYTINGQSFGALAGAARVSSTEFWAAGDKSIVHYVCQTT